MRVPACPLVHACFVPPIVSRLTTQLFLLLAPSSTYAQGSNDLKVQASGDGGLEEVADEFRDGRSVCPLLTAGESRHPL